MNGFDLNTTFPSTHLTDMRFWSVMIPTYNPRQDFLRKALDSVLQSSLSSDEMQIEVIDDCSPDVDVPAMVKAIAGERVFCSRSSQNLGLAGCWNACIARARGEWVHILHQDDYVLPGFYARLRRVAEEHPEAALIATRTFLVDEDGVITGVTPRNRILENGKLATRFFWDDNPLQCAGVAIRKSFYVAKGGFRSDLIYTLDVEMWTRAAFTGGCVVAPEVLACFRQSEESETVRLQRNGAALADSEKLLRDAAKLEPSFDLKAFLLRHSGVAFDQATRFWKLGDHKAAKAAWTYFRSKSPITTQLRVVMSRIARRLARQLVPDP